MIKKGLRVKVLAGKNKKVKYEEVRCVDEMSKTIAPSLTVRLTGCAP